MTDDVRPKSPSAADKTGSGLRPEEYNPEMAQAVIAREMINKMPKPAIISKEFLVYQGIWESLNHRLDHKTGFDSSLRCLLYRSVADESVNRDGAFFNAFWAWLNKPKIIMQGMPMTQSFQEEKPGLLSRLFGKISGKGNTQENGNQ